MFLIITLTTIYILSVWRMWYIFRYAYYHEKGMNYGYNPFLLDYFVTFCPVINTIFIFVIYDWKNSKYKSNNNIFKPNKPLK